MLKKRLDNRVVPQRKPEGRQRFTLISKLYVKVDIVKYRFCHFRCDCV